MFLHNNSACKSSLGLRCNIEISRIWFACLQRSHRFFCCTKYLSSSTSHQMNIFVGVSDQNSPFVNLDTHSLAALEGDLYEQVSYIYIAHQFVLELVDTYGYTQCVWTKYMAYQTMSCTYSRPCEKLGTHVVCHIIGRLGWRARLVVKWVSTTTTWTNHSTKPRTAGRGWEIFGGGG